MFASTEEAAWRNSWHDPEENAIFFLDVSSTFDAFSNIISTDIIVTKSRFLNCHHSLTTFAPDSAAHSATLLCFHVVLPKKRGNLFLVCFQTSDQVNQA